MDDEAEADDDEAGGDDGDDDETQSDRDALTPSAQENDSVALHRDLDRILDERRRAQQRGEDGPLSGEQLGGEEDEEDTGAGGDDRQEDVPGLHDEDDEEEEDGHMSVERPRGRRVLDDDNDDDRPVRKQPFAWPPPHLNKQGTRNISLPPRLASSPKQDASGTLLTARHLDFTIVGTPERPEPTHGPEGDLFNAPSPLPSEAGHFEVRIHSFNALTLTPRVHHPRLTSNLTRVCLWRERSACRQSVEH